MPDLVRIAEEVEATKTPRKLMRDNKPVAVISPVEKATGKAQKGTSKSKADYEAFRAAFGSWRDVDTESLLSNIYADRRRTNTRPSAKL